MLTLSTCRRALWSYASSVPYSTASATDIGEFDARLNQVVERFFTLGTWRSMWKRINLTVFGSTLTLPRGFDTCRGVDLSHGATPIYSEFHRFSSYGCTSTILQCYFRSLTLIDENAQTFLLPTGTFTLRAVATEAADPGLSLIGGVDQAGNELFGSINLPLINGASDGTQAYTELPSIQKVVTTNAVSLYAVDTTTAVATLIANYAPGETIPVYRRYSIGAGLDGEVVSALCKLGFVAVLSDSDLVIPGNLGALKLGLMSLAFEDRNDMERAALYMGPNVPEKTGKPYGAIDLLDSERSELEEAEIAPFTVSSNFGAGNILSVR